MTLKSILAGTAALSVVASAAVAADSITVVSWGGAYTKSQVEAYHKPWVAKTGNQIISEDYNGGLAEVKAQVEAGNVTWDVIDVEFSDAIRGCDEGLLEEIDHSILPPAPDGTPAIDDFIAGALPDCAVSNIVMICSKRMRVLIAPLPSSTASRIALSGGRLALSLRSFWRMVKLL